MTPREEPSRVPEPVADWTLGAPDPLVASDLGRLLDELIERTDEHGQTYAVVVVHRGLIVAERYAGALAKSGRPDLPVQASTPLLSWSMAKSVLHALYGVLVREGLIALGDPAPVPSWQVAGDPRRDITIDHLLAMRDGLDFAEEYADDRSDVREMLFRSGADDVAGYAMARPAAHPPGEFFNYSSGTSNILARIAGDIIGDLEGPGPDRFTSFVERELFTPLGITSARLGFDVAGTWVASSYVFATARDFARFGLLYLRDGTWQGRRILPAGWVEHGCRPRSVDPRSGSGEQVWYGSQWYVVGDDLGTFRASGYRGQWILASPRLDLLVVRLGRGAESCEDANTAWRAAIVDAFRPLLDTAVTSGRSG